MQYFHTLNDEDLKQKHRWEPLWEGGVVNSFSGCALSSWKRSTRTAYSTYLTRVNPLMYSIKKNASPAGADHQKNGMTLLDGTVRLKVSRTLSRYRSNFPVEIALEF